LNVVIFNLKNLQYQSTHFTKELKIVLTFKPIFFFNLYLLLVYTWKE